MEAVEKPVENVEKCGFDIVFSLQGPNCHHGKWVYIQLNKRCAGRVMLPFYKGVYFLDFAEKVDISSKWTGSCPCVKRDSA